MDKADRIIAAAEKEAADYMQRTGGNSVVGTYHQLGYLKHELRTAYELLAIASNPPGCTEVESDGVRYGLKWNKDGEFWEIFIGGQCVNVALSGGLIDELCEEAERIALDGEAA